MIRYYVCMNKDCREYGKIYAGNYGVFDRSLCDVCGVMETLLTEEIEFELGIGPKPMAFEPKGVLTKIAYKVSNTNKMTHECKPGCEHDPRDVDLQIKDEALKL